MRVMGMGVGATLLLCLLGPAGSAAQGSAVDVSTEADKITASDGSIDHFFGRSLALREGQLVVGADGSGESRDRSGAVYVLRHGETGWVEIAQLLHPEGRPGDFFGRVVCFTPDGSVAVGVPDDDPPNLPYGTGSVQIFDPEAGWTRSDRLFVAPLSSRGAQLGRDIDCSDDRIVAGAPYENDTLDHEGSVSVFRLGGAGWQLEERFSPTLPRRQGYLGWGVAIDGDRAVASGPGREPDRLTFYHRNFYRWVVDDELEVPNVYELEMSGDLVVAGAPHLDATQAGAVLVFRRILGEWTEVARLESDQPAAGNGFGASIALDGDLLAVGEERADHGGPDHGAVHLFRRDGDTWRRERILVASDGFEYQLFGHSVALEGRRVVVGAALDDERGSRSGAVYEFRLPLEIAVDLWPLRRSHRLVPGWPGPVAVALHGSADFDPEDVDPASLALGPDGASPLVVTPGRDLDDDGLPDRVAAFRVADTGIALGDDTLCLVGATADGFPFEGCTPIETVAGCGRGHQVAWALPLLLVLRRRGRIGRRSR